MEADISMSSMNDISTCEDSIEAAGSQPTNLSKTERALEQCNGHSQTSSSTVHFGRGELVTVVVGAIKQQYTYHKAVLCAKCPYFATSLKMGWNGSTNTISLEDAKPKSFETVMDWIYGQSTPAIWVAQRKTTGAAVADVYKLTDFFMLISFKNDLINALIAWKKKDNSIFSLATLVQVYERDLQETQLFRMVLRSCVRSFSRRPKRFDGSSQKDTIAIMQEHPNLMVIFMETLRDYSICSWERFWDEGRCQYHEHVDGQECDAGTIATQSSS